MQGKCFPSQWSFRSLPAHSWGCLMLICNKLWPCFTLHSMFQLNSFSSSQNDKDTKRQPELDPARSREGISEQEEKIVRHQPLGIFCFETGSHSLCRPRWPPNAWIKGVYYHIWDSVQPNSSARPRNSVTVTEMLGRLKFSFKSEASIYHW